MNQNQQAFLIFLIDLISMLIIYSHLKNIRQILNIILHIHNLSIYVLPSLQIIFLNFMTHNIYLLQYLLFNLIRVMILSLSLLIFKIDLMINLFDYKISILYLMNH
jgi:hypothetical protein